MIINLCGAIAPLYSHMEHRIELPSDHLLLLALQVFENLREFVIMTFSGSLLEHLNVTRRGKIIVTCGNYGTQTIRFCHFLENLRRASLILLLLVLLHLLFFGFLLILAHAGLNTILKLLLNSI